MKNLYRIVSFLFLIESLALLIGIEEEKVSYGLDLGTVFMEFIIKIVAGIVLITSAFMWGRKAKDWVWTSLCIFLIGIGLYYVMEDQFRVSK